MPNDIVTYEIELYSHSDTLLFILTCSDITGHHGLQGQEGYGTLSNN